MIGKLSKPLKILVLLDILSCVLCLESSFKLNCGGRKIGEFLPDVTYEYLKIRGETDVSRVETDIAIQSSSEEIEKVSRTHRWGRNTQQFSYIIGNLENGKYSCNLYFSETFPDYFDVGKRVFDVSVNEIRESNIDVFKLSGGYKSVSMKFSGVLVDGKGITIILKPSKGEAFISAIDCSKQVVNANSDSLKDLPYEFRFSSFLSGETSKGTFVSTKPSSGQEYSTNYDIIWASRGVIYLKNAKSLIVNAKCSKSGTVSVQFQGEVTEKDAKSMFPENSVLVIHYEDFKDCVYQERKEVKLENAYYMIIRQIAVQGEVVTITGEQTAALIQYDKYHVSTEATTSVKGGSTKIGNVGSALSLEYSPEHKLLKYFKGKFQLLFEISDFDINNFNVEWNGLFSPMKFNVEYEWELDVTFQMSLDLDLNVSIPREEIHRLEPVAIPNSGIPKHLLSFVKSSGPRKLEVLADFVTFGFYFDTGILFEMNAFNYSKSVFKDSRFNYYSGRRKRSVSIPPTLPASTPYDVEEKESTGNTTGKEPGFTKNDIQWVPDGLRDFRTLNTSTYVGARLGIFFHAYTLAFGTTFDVGLQAELKTPISGKLMPPTSKGLTTSDSCEKCHRGELEFKAQLDKIGPMRIIAHKNETKAISVLKNLEVSVPLALVCISPSNELVCGSSCCQADTQQCSTEESVESKQCVAKVTGPLCTIEVRMLENVYKTNGECPDPVDHSFVISLNGNIIRSYKVDHTGGSQVNAYWCAEAYRKSFTLNLSIFERRVQSLEVSLEGGSSFDKISASISAHERWTNILKCSKYCGSSTFHTRYYAIEVSCGDHMIYSVSNTCTDFSTIEKLSTDNSCPKNQVIQRL